nr:hypothetical protein [Tanacetum cinerariifolium]
SQQHVGNVEHNDDSDSDLDDVFVCDNESEESETASVDHLSDGEEEAYDARTRKPDTTPKKYVSAKKDVSDEDNLEKIMINPCMKVKEIIESILKKYKWKMREKHAKRNDGICPNIRKNIEKYKDLHRHQNVIPSCKSSFEVRNGYEGFKVDERSRSCFCRGWKLSGIPCEHGISAIYFLHKDLENYVSDWYNNDVFVNANNHYIEGMNGMDQSPTTDYQKPLPPIVKRMLGRPTHKRKRDVMKDNGNRTRISRKGQLNHCTLCKKIGHNQRACPSKPEGTRSVRKVTTTGEIVTASFGKVTAAGEIVTVSGGNVTASGDLVSAKGGNVTTKGGNVSARGGKVTARGGIVMGSGGNVSARGGKVTTSGGKVTTRGGKASARSGKVSARGGKVTSTPSTPPLRFEMSTPDSASNAVRTNRGVIKVREGVWIRSPKKERSSYVNNGSSSINKLMTVNGKVNSMDLPRHAWPEGITLQDCIIYVATQSEIALSHSQPIEFQEEEPRQQQPPKTTTTKATRTK